jgi:hypothetical protein
MIKEKGMLIIRYLDMINGCYTIQTNKLDTSKTQQMFKTHGEVIWSRNGRKQQWGGVFTDSNRLLVRLDFPKESYHVQDIADRLLLPVISSKARVSGVRKVITKKNPPYDSIDIILYSDTLLTYDVMSKHFSEFLLEVFNKSCRF